MTNKKSAFETLSSIDVSNHIDTIKMKRGKDLQYLSWSWAWGIVKSIYPDTPTPRYTKYPEMTMETKQVAYKTKWGEKYKTVVLSYKLTGREVPYLNTPTGTMLECTVTIQGEDYTESLYVMDTDNSAVINPSQQQIYKTQKRCMVKCLAMAGLGLNLYAGEDLPMGDANEADQRKRNEVAQHKQKASHDSLQRGLEMLADMLNKKPEEIKASLIAEYKDTDLYKKDPTEALLNGTREMYRQVTQENKAKGVG